MEQDLDFSLDDLRAEFPERELTVTLQCAGNRRADLIAVRDIPGESPWGPGATGTATLARRSAGRRAGRGRRSDGARHVGFEGADMSLEVDEPYGGSIPLRDVSRPSRCCSPGR